MLPRAQLDAEVARHPYPLLFATVSGAHLYGFPSVDSYFDLRGCHILPPREVVEQAYAELPVKAPRAPAAARVHAT